MGAVEKKLKEMEMDYARAVVEEGGIQVDQLFFHDPDGFMIEICNCDNLPVVPLARAPPSPYKCQPPTHHLCSAYALEVAKHY